MRFRFLALILIPVLCVAAIRAEDLPCASEGPEVVSTMGLSFGSFEEKGYTIVPVEDIVPAPDPGDLAKPMLFEIVRPNLAAISIGRILSSCGCLSIRSPQRNFLPGERAFIELRNVKPTPKEGATYAFFVQLTAPEELTLRRDVFVKSERAPTKAPEQAPEKTGEKPEENAWEKPTAPLPDLTPAP